AMKKSFKPPVPTASPVSQGSFGMSAVGAQKAFEQKMGGSIDAIETAGSAQAKEGIPPAQDWLKPKIFKGGGLV
ncbi:MAG: hypothetical protein AAB929_02735, partial [Patescibacteria group bacterium]